MNLKQAVFVVKDEKKKARVRAGSIHVRAHDRIQSRGIAPVYRVMDRLSQVLTLCATAERHQLTKNKSLVPLVKDAIVILEGTFGL